MSLHVQISCFLIESQYTLTYAHKTNWYLDRYPEVSMLVPLSVLNRKPVGIVLQHYIFLINRLQMQNKYTGKSMKFNMPVFD